ncbi:MAG: A/G-specific adenine glycosylase [Planctomycetes bacterium]|nr:A/G-specific adenine glycosylase [Planctomycetota bacterium]
MLTWFDAGRRDLPWRRTADPYAIWVSEIMLQQTQVATVVDYYRRFLQAFPSVEALADADLDEVLKLWEGLGYYSRARSLHKAARHVAADLDGRVPHTVEELRKLPGIGAYTAGAIASIAFGVAEPVVDGNVARMLCRLQRIAQPPKAPATQRQLWDLAADLVPPGTPGDFNQAMMELGAMVCRPTNPDCPRCPLGTLCEARRAGLQHDLPPRTPGKAVPHHTVVAGVIFRSDGRVLIDRRPQEAMLGGLWEFPGGKVRPGEGLAEALQREVREEVGLEVGVDDTLCVVNHAYSHFRITLHAFGCRRVSGRARAIECDAVRWVSPDQLDRYAFPRANGRIIEQLT